MFGVFINIFIIISKDAKRGIARMCDYRREENEQPNQRKSNAH